MLQDLVQHQNSKCIYVVNCWSRLSLCNMHLILLSFLFVIYGEMDDDVDDDDVDIDVGMMFFFFT